MSLLTPTIVFFVCHAGPADHFAAFAKLLEEQSVYNVQVYAAGDALKKLNERNIQTTRFFFKKETVKEQLAHQLAQKCKNAALVITDVGHEFDIALHKAFDKTGVIHLAYYDNPESYVPGGYSKTAARVMEIAQGTIFANRNLAKADLYEGPNQKIELPFKKRMPLGYYPLESAERLEKLRTELGKKRRADFFAENSIQDQGQKILVYLGGNNEAYYGKALPAFLQILEEVSQKEKAFSSRYLILFQQHPGAKAEDRDKKCVMQWLKKYKAESPLIFSHTNSDNTLLIADAILYYQTSMGPLVTLAGVLPIQVGHEPYRDLLVRSRLCPVATNTEGFLKALAQVAVPVSLNQEAILERLGASSRWQDAFTQIIDKQTKEWKP